jgi:SAM-dependent methyltransferase
MDKKDVGIERWREAQAWELAFWNRQNVPSVWWKRALRPALVLLGLRPRARNEYDDRNLWWREKFEGYSMLPDHIANLCELGCGPYTNARLIAEGRRVDSISCSDPLAGSYVRFPKAWLGRAVRAGLVNVDTHPAEECPYRSDYFDVCVLMNVLDHVRDPVACLESAIRITKPGGYLVFSQDLTGEGDRLPSNPGHPFTFGPGEVEPLLDGRFDRAFYRVLSREELGEPEMHCGALMYVGRKRSASG